MKHLLIAAVIFVATVTIATAVVSGDSKSDEESGKDKDFTVVGARVITCAGCRLNSLPRVRNFLENEARSYPALHIEYQQGRDPELQFLDKHRGVVATHDMSALSPLQIAQLLNSNNIHTWTPAPEYEAPEFHETAHCVAFRQTAECSPHGRREPQFDSPCLTYIEESRSGYCQCKKGRENVELACGHAAESCDMLCAPEEAAPSEPEVPEMPKPNDDL